MDAYVRARRELRFVLVPEFGRLVLHLPLALRGARREVALLGAAAFLVGARTHDHAGEWFRVAIAFVRACRVVEAIPWSFTAQRASQCFRFEQAAARQAIDGAIRIRAALRERYFVLPVHEVQVPLGREPV